MADNTDINAGSGGDKIVTREVSHGGDTAKMQGVFLMGITGSEGSYTAAAINGDATNGLDVDVTRVPTDPFGANADAASATGSISAKLRFIAATGIPITSIAAGDNNIGNVDVVTLPALAAGTNNIGDVDVLTLPALPAGTNNIGDVDILSIVPGTGATNLGKAEDAAHASGDVGVMALAVRQNSQSDLGADGDYVPFTIDDSGGLRVSIVAGAGSGGTAAADDADFTAGTTQGTPVMGVYESSPTSVTDGDLGTVGITATRALKVSVVSGGITGAVEDAVASGSAEGVLGIVVRDDALATLTPVDGDYTVNRVNARGAMWVCLDSTAAQTVSLAAGTNNIGDVDILSIAAGDNNIGNVDIVTMPNVTLAAGTNTNEVVGDAATDAAVSGNPVYIAGRGNSGTPTAMSANNDVTPFWLTLNGAVVVAGDIVDDAAFTPATSRVQAVGFFADETATDSVDEGDLGAARMTLDRKQITTSYVHAAAGGATPYKNLDVDETEDDIKTSPGKLYWVHVMNLHASSTLYIKFYNATAANVTVGTTTPVLTFPVKSGPGGFTIDFGPQGLQFDTAISVAATTGLADNNTGAPGANEVVLNAGYA